MRRLLIAVIGDVIARLSREEFQAVMLLQSPVHDQSHIFLVDPLHREPPPFDMEKFVRELCPLPAPPKEFISLKRQKRTRGFPGKRAHRISGSQKQKMRSYELTQKGMARR